MVYNSSLNGLANEVSFYAYEQGGNLTTTVALDSQGPKYVPYLCLACHGGFYQYFDGSPVSNTVTGANFLPFDVYSFQYSTQPNFTLADQEEEFRLLNKLVYETDPNVPIQGLISGWYTDTTGLATPGTKFFDGFVPDQYAATADRELYTDVIKPYCRSCHVAQPSYIDMDVPAELSNAYGEVFLSFNMPHAELTNHNFWNSRAPIQLAGYFGWSLRVNRLDDPAPMTPPNGCDTGDISDSCSLREAIMAANEDSLLSIISFDVGEPFTLSQLGVDNNAVAGDLDITTSGTVVILGNGAALTIINGNGQERVFHKLGTGQLVIQGVTIRGGAANGGSGGGVYNAAGTLVLNNSFVTNNSADYGGGIANAASATLEVNNSTIGPNNNASDEGGGLKNTGAATLLNTTVSGNYAHVGAGITTDAYSTVTIRHGTVTRNQADLFSGGMAGGILTTGGIVNLKNSIVAGNIVGLDCHAPNGPVIGVFASQGYNLVGANGSANGCPSGGTDSVLALTITTTLEVTYDSLYAGVPYHPLVPNGPAVDAIPLTAPQNCAPPSYDQRYEARPLDGNADFVHACDIGAYEAPTALAIDTGYFLSLSATSGGTVSASPPGGQYLGGTVVTLTAAANPFFTFTDWMVDGGPGGDANPRTVTMDANHTVTAKFASIVYVPFIRR